MQSRRCAAFFGVVALATAGALIRAKAQSEGIPATVNAPIPKKAEEQFKNIQVLKGIPADQLIPAMQFITASLGVECDYCHVHEAFDKDDKKPKQTAREMMEMMFAINKNNFDGHRDVTCYSCHRGSIDPMATPPVMPQDLKSGTAETRNSEEPKSEATETRVVGGPTTDQLLDKYLNAVGGAGAIEEVNSRVMKGTISFGDRNVPIDIFSKDPDKRISFTHTPDGDSVTAFDGREGWLGVPGRPVREMHGSDIDAAAMDADLHFAAHLKTMFSDMRLRGVEKIGEHDAYLVVAGRGEKPPLRLYFDTHSGLLVRLVRYAETPLGRMPTQIDYEDYREVGGVKIPFRWTLARPSGRFAIQLTDVKQNIPVDDAKFAKPPVPPSEQNKPK